VEEERRGKWNFTEEEPRFAAIAGRTEGNCCLNTPSVQQYQFVLFLALQMIT